MHTNNILPFQPKASSVLRIIREVARDSSRIRLGPAIQAEFDNGAISVRQTINCLQQGALIQGPYTDDYGLTCCELEWVTAGRLVRVVVSIEGRTPVRRVLHVLFAEEV